MYTCRVSLLSEAAERIVHCPFYLDEQFLLHLQCFILEDYRDKQFIPHLLFSDQRLKTKQLPEMLLRYAKHLFRTDPKTIKIIKVNVTHCFLWYTFSPHFNILRHRQTGTEK